MSTPRPDIYGRAARRPGAPASDQEPFLRRMVILPFSPAMWSQAASWPATHVLIPLLLLAAGVGAFRGLHFAVDARLKLRRAANTYAQQYPGFTIANGVATVDNDGKVHHVDGDLTVLVDPQETIPISVINTTHLLVVRRESVYLREKDGQMTHKRLRDIQQRFRVDPLRVDADSIRRFDRRWGLPLVFVVPLAMAAANIGSELLALPFIPLVSAALADSIRGRALGLELGPCFRVTLAAYSLLLLLEVPLYLLGLSPGACWGFVFWNVVLAPLAVWRVGLD